MNLPHEVVLYSSGWESTGCALKSKSNVPLVFFDYGQSYLSRELDNAERFSQCIGRQLIKMQLKDIIDKAKTNVVVPDRNLLMMRSVVKRGAKIIWFGTKGIHPWFDRYGDSNWTTLKREATRLGVQVKLPWTMIPKFAVRWYVQKSLAKRVIFCSEKIIP